jgi:hypothetical protein
MRNRYEDIITILDSLNPGQKKGALLCMKRDESLIICIGFECIDMLDSLTSVDDIISGKAHQFCEILKENSKLRSVLSDLISRITHPDDLMRDFVDFRVENWQE